MPDRGSRAWRDRSSPSPGACCTITEGREADAAARRLFGFSILYLFLLFAVLLVEHLARRGSFEVATVALVMNSDADEERQRLKRQRMRSLAIALALGALVALFYVATIVRMGGNVLNQAACDREQRSVTAENGNGGEKVGAQRRDRTVVVACVAMVAAMAGLSYAAVPLYRLLLPGDRLSTAPRSARPSPPTRCSTARSRSASTPTSRPTCRGRSSRVQRTLDVKIGENTLAFYRATNTSDQPITGTADVQRDARVGRRLYFNKVQCFCFTEQTLQPGQTVDMPVSFFVDPTFDRGR